MESFRSTEANINGVQIHEDQRNGAQDNEATSTTQTKVSHVNKDYLGQFVDKETLEKWKIPDDLTNLQVLKEAAKRLRGSNIPVGFPTETVYGLGADATRSEAVKGIYKAKGRPSDNPLIIHVCDLTMLKDLLVPADQPPTSQDLIPDIYKPLIKRFWPGPLTILLKNQTPSKLAPEVTAGLPTFGVRMPDSPLALSLIQLAGVPLAAPSANASTKPSPTTASHVLHDLDGKIELILDGGPCAVGVESTVVDGLCNPPVVLRPGGVSIDAIRECPGWEGVVKGYKDQSEVGSHAPRAPGMKYKHYSPRAKVILYEAASTRKNPTRRLNMTGIPMEVWLIVEAKEKRLMHLGYEEMSFPIKIGIVQTKHWQDWAGFNIAKWNHIDHCMEEFVDEHEKDGDFGTIVLGIKKNKTGSLKLRTGELFQGELDGSGHKGKFSTVRTGFKGTPELVADMIEISLGTDTKDIAHGLFSALRELDQRGADVIYVEGIEDEGDIAAAVMNRLRKAASVIEE